jgi:hypothetical protein
MCGADLQRGFVSGYVSLEERIPKIIPCDSPCGAPCGSWSPHPESVMIAAAVPTRPSSPMPRAQRVGMRILLFQPVHLQRWQHQPTLQSSKNRAESALYPHMQDDGCGGRTSSHRPSSSGET